MKKALPEAMAASDPATRADAFWVRTFLATSLRIGDAPRATSPCAKGWVDARNCEPTNAP